MNANPAKEYNEMGEAYAHKAENSFHNAYYDRPSVVALLGEVKEKQVLEVGCAGGALTEWLVNEGAKVTAIDISEEMVNYTKKRLGGKATIFTANISEPLEFINSESVDVIVASLVLHYISNWLPVFSEFQRILKPDGEIIISTHHPHADWKWHDRPNYFKKELYEEFWNLEGKAKKVSYYHRTLANMFAIFRKYSFYVDVLLEPLPKPEAKEIDPKKYEYLSKNPHFIFLRLKKRFTSSIFKAVL
ncbi:MAG: class I SAM-dependent methyltransferase [Candidatus Hermodarchaeota archaeon]